MEPTSRKPRNLLLHACCGPCSLEPCRILQSEGRLLTIYYANSNIAPASEYARRLETIKGWASQEGIPLVEGAYEPDAWEEAAGLIGDAALEDARGRAPSEGVPAPLALDPARREARCRACYRLRFEEAARYAADHGFEAVGTTLSVSPYQYTEVIHEELERAASSVGIAAEFRDFRPCYSEATRRSRALGMYRQNYCGCRLSQEEAAAEREQRKRERAAAREAETRLHAAERAAAEVARAARRAERAAYDEKQRRKREVLRSLRGLDHAE